MAEQKPEIKVFMSCAKADYDDPSIKKSLEDFHEKLQAELRSQLHDDSFTIIWLHKPNENRADNIQNHLSGAKIACFIPIITPKFLADSNCTGIFKTFFGFQNRPDSQGFILPVEFLPIVSDRQKKPTGEQEEIVLYIRRLQEKEETVKLHNVNIGTRKYRKAIQAIAQKIVVWINADSTTENPPPPVEDTPSKQPAGGAGEPNQNPTELINGILLVLVTIFFVVIVFVFFPEQVEAIITAVLLIFASIGIVLLVFFSDIIELYRILFKNPISSIVGGILVFAEIVLLLLRLFFFSNPSEVPINSPTPPPEPMTGDINIAFAKFAEDDTTASNLEQSVKDYFATSLPAGLTVAYEQVNLMNSDEEAIQLGRAINATLVVWAGKTGNVIEPKFTILDYQEGMAFAIPFRNLPLPENEVQRAEYHKESAEIIALFTVGLYYEAQQDYASAKNTFETTLTEVDQLDDVEEEEKYPIQSALNFYIGKSIAAPKEETNTFQWKENQQEALGYYSEALELNPNFSWAHVGRGSVYFDLATRDTEMSNGDIPPDTDLLAQALDEYETALEIQTRKGIVKNRPVPEALVAPKAHTNIGNVYAELAYMHYHNDEDDEFKKNAESSIEAFDEAIEAYEKQAQKQPETFPYKFLAYAYYAKSGIYFLQDNELEERTMLETCIDLAQKDLPRAESTMQDCQGRLNELTGSEVGKTYVNPVDRHNHNPHFGTLGVLAVQ